MKTSIFILTGLLFILSLQGAEASEAKKLFEQKCSHCHSLDNPRSERHDRKGWALKVDLMKSYGAKLTDQEEKMIVDYLTAEFGK